MGVTPLASLPAIMLEDYPRTPSLTTSEETISSGGEVTPSKLPSSNGTSPSTGKGKERAALRTSILPLPSTYTISCSPSPLSHVPYNRMRGLIAAWSSPTILQSLLTCLGWAEFHAVMRTCRDLRNLFDIPGIKYISLARFVPGYRSEGRHEEDEDKFRVGLTDLDALMQSQSLPLHHYPMHAVYVVSAVNGIPPAAEAYSGRLVRLVQAHSKFVLLLRSKAPRRQVTTEPDGPIRRTSPASTLRELTFPAPLSYFDSSNTKSLSLPPLVPSSHKKVRNNKRRTLPDENPSPPPRTSSSLSSKRRMSIFGRSRERIPLPEPQSSPPSIRYYSSLSRARRTTTMPMKDDELAPILFNHPSRFMVDCLPPPRYPFAYRNASSPNSSVGSLCHYSSASPAQSSMSLHDLLNAMSHTYAPILRVFVPCSSLISPEVIAAIESQLFASGLLKHLRTGDVICNLGYVPEDSDDARGWLIFTGEALWPFFPPAAPPVPNATNLPSPLYLSHLLPPFENFRFVLNLPRGVLITFSLALLSSDVPSPHSPTGYARAKRYAWLGRMRVRPEETGVLMVGEGWAGEWVLEAEGTKEGKQMLADVLEENERQSAGREWEIIREKSGTGRVWLRLIPEQRDLDSLSAELSTSGFAR